MIADVTETAKTTRLQAARFAIVGIANTVVGVAVIFLLYQVFHLGVVLSNAVGYAVGLVMSYVLNGSWSFGASRYDLASIAKFAGLVAVAFATNILVIHQLIAFGQPYPIAQCAGVISYSALVFFGMKYVVFAK